MGRRGKTIEPAVARSQAGDTDPSDLDSVAYSSVAGDNDTVHGDSDSEILGPHAIDVLRTNVENAADKSNNTRIEAMKNLIGLLRKCVLDEDLEHWKASLCDSLEKNLRRTDDESTLACGLVGLLAIQKAFDIEDELRGPLKALVHLANDYSKPEALRADAAQNIGIGAFFSADQPSEIRDYVTTLANLWSAVRTTSQTSALFISALEAWTVLLHRAGDAAVNTAVEDSQPKLCQFLSATNVEIRIAAGEALATLYQLARESDEDFEFGNQTYVEEIIEKLSLDSAKYHAKRDKRAQKLTFRQINDVMFNDAFPESQVRFNRQETLEITDCMGRLLYDNLCISLKSHMNIHLSKNAVIRDAFDLGPIVETDVVKETKQQKKDRQQTQVEMSKMRKIHRNKQRDKKAY
uniref:IFRD domain-containing protein n=1 Tax=Panagrellus redivivus TaxID=6233 RepID=A0A7E4ZQ42_PANRE